MIKLVFALFSVLSLMGCQSEYEKTLYSAESGSVDSQLKLGYMNLRGDNTAENEDKAIYWFTKAALLGNPDAQYRLSRIYYANRLTSDSNEKNEYEVSGSAEKAVFWASLASKNGHMPATARLAMLYTDGIGVKKNETYAIQILSEAIRSENSAVQYQLGRMYMDGLGVKQDIPYGLKLIKQSSSQNYVLAQLDYCYMIEEGKLIKFDPVASFNCYKQAAINSPVFADYLADRYAFGHGTKEDSVLAYAWFKVSMKYYENPLPDISAHKFDIVSDRLNIFEKIEAEYLAWRWKQGNAIKRVGMSI